MLSTIAMTPSTDSKNPFRLVYSTVATDAVRTGTADFPCSASGTGPSCTSVSRLPSRGGLLRPLPLPNDRRRTEPQWPQPFIASCLLGSWCSGRRRLDRGGRSGGGSVSNCVSITYLHLSPSSLFGSAGNGPLIISFSFRLLLKKTTPTRIPDRK